MSAERPGHHDPLALESGLESLRERQGLERLNAAFVDSRFFFGAHPEILGRGAEHLVVGFRDAPRDVQKINVLLLWSEMCSAARGGIDTRSPLEVCADLRVSLRDQERYVQRANNDLRNYFSDAVPQETVHIRELLLTPEVFRVFIDAWAARKEEEEDRERVKKWFGTEPVAVPFLVREQKRARPDQLAPSAHPVRARYTELRFGDPEGIDPVLYSAAMRRFVQLEKQEQDIHPLLPMALNPVALPFAERILADPSLRKAVRAFVGRSIAYTTNMKRIVDCIGKNNVNIYLAPITSPHRAGEGGIWRMNLLDAQYPDEEHQSVWIDGKRALERIHMSWRQHGRAMLRHGEHIALSNMLAYVRLVNALAELSGSRERLRCMDEEVDFPGYEWFHAMSALEVRHENGIWKPAWPRHEGHQQQRGVGVMAPMRIPVPIVSHDSSRPSRRDEPTEPRLSRDAIMQPLPGSRRGVFPALSPTHTSVGAVEQKRSPSIPPSVSTGEITKLTTPSELPVIPNEGDETR
jgi:hypothetical protein